MADLKRPLAKSPKRIRTLASYSAPIEPVETDEARPAKRHQAMSLRSDDMPSQPMSFTPVPSTLRRSSSPAEAPIEAAFDSLPGIATSSTTESEPSAAASAHAGPSTLASHARDARTYQAARSADVWDLGAITERTEEDKEEGENDQEKGDVKK